MLLLHAILVVSVLAPALSKPDLPHAIAKIGEARARALANRAKIRANNARIANHIRTSVTPRPKRENQEYAPTQPPAPTPGAEPYAPHQAEEPELVHICPVEDEHVKYRSADDHGEEENEKEHDFFHIIEQDSSENSDRRMNEQVEARHEPSLDQALEELSEVTEILHEFEAENARHSGLETTQTLSSPEHHFENPLIEQIHNSEKNLEELEKRLRDADAHHHHLRPHRLLPFVPQAHIVTPGLHLPQAQILTPGLNLHINQNQAVHSGLNQPLVHSNTFAPGFSTVNQVVPTQNTLVSTQTSPLIQHSGLHRNAAAEAQRGFAQSQSNRKLIPGSSIHGNPRPFTVDQSFNSNQNRPGFTNNFALNSGLSQTSNNRPINQNRPLFTSSNLGFTSNFALNNGLSQTSNIRRINQNRPLFTGSNSDFGRVRESAPSQIEQNDEDAKNREAENEEIENSSFDSREANPTHKKKKKQKMMPQYYPVYNSYNSGHYRDAEEDADNGGEEMDDLSPNTREASPTHKKKKKQKMMPQYYPVYNSYNYGHYRAAEDADNEGEEIDDLSLNSREASPTHKKKKKQKMQHYPVYYPSGRYREAEDETADNPAEDIISSIFDSREASPTHHKKNKNKKPQHYPVQYGGRQYRQFDDSSEEFLEDTSSPPEAREARTHKKKKKTTVIYYPVYYPQAQTYDYYREAQDNDSSMEFNPEDVEDADFFRDGEASMKNEKRFQNPPRDAEETNTQLREDDSVLEDLTSSNFLFDMPVRRRFSDQFKRSLDKDLDAILGMERHIVDSLKNHSKNDGDLELVADIGDRALSSLEDKRKIVKRSIPLTRLIVDPHVKLDVPKTIENVGAATKTAFEDERAPLYHFKNMVGASKNALLSAMRIAPQNMIIPSEYEIVRSSERDVPVGRSSDDPVAHTFQKVGEMVRDSLISSQETASHLSDVAHSARNVLHSARRAVPRLMIPYSQFPAVQDTRKNNLLKKAALITPRLVDLTHETSPRKASHSRNNFVGLGHLMDAVGMSTPGSKKVDIRKIIFDPRGIREGKIDKRLAHLYNRVSDNLDHNVDTVKEAVDTLEDAKLSVGAKNLKDFLVKMRSELTQLIDPTQHHKIKKNKIKKKKHQETKEMGKFVENLFDGSEEPQKVEGRMGKDNNEIVGGSLFLTPELLHPFMGRATETDLENFLHDNGDDTEKLRHSIEHRKKEESKDDHQELNHLNQAQDHHNNSDLGHVLGAINPLMFERMYNQTVKVNKEDVGELHPIQGQKSEGDDTVGTGFMMNGAILKPFMGQARPEQVEDLLHTYNDDSEDRDYNELDK